MERSAVGDRFAGYFSVLCKYRIPFTPFIYVNIAWTIYFRIRRGRLSKGSIQQSPFEAESERAKQEATRSLSTCNSRDTSTVSSSGNAKRAVYQLPESLQKIGPQQSAGSSSAFRDQQDRPDRASAPGVAPGVAPTSFGSPHPHRSKSSPTDPIPPSNSVRNATQIAF
jgi:hypothetical protein